MADKRKIRADRVIIIVLAIVLLVSLLGFGVYKLLDYIFFNSSGNSKPSGNDDTPIVNPEPIETIDDVKVSLNDDNYQVYISDDSEIDFNFIVAELKFVGSEPISFDLGNLRTSEKIYLNDVSKYMNRLNERGYKLNKLGVVNTVVSTEKEYICKVFIPYTTKNSSLRILNSQDATMIEFDLNRHQSDITSIKIDTTQEIVVGNTNVTVSSCFVSDIMLHNGEEFSASAQTYYTFRISVSKLEGNVMISDAQFVRNSSEEVLKCLGSDYSALNISNCIGKKLVEGDNGALFFESSSKEINPDFSGYLLLKFSNSQEWVKIPTILE